MKITYLVEDLEQRIGENPRVYLRRAYSRKKQSISTIAKNLDVRREMISKALDHYHIPKMDLSELKLPPGVKKPTKEQLLKWYVKESRTTYEIARKVGVEGSTVCNWLRSNNITIRKGTEARLRMQRPSKKQLYRWYIKERKSSHKIAENLGLSHMQTVLKWLKDYGIPIRSQS